MSCSPSRFEFATASDPSLNYCLWPYPPQASAEDKFRSINILYQSFEYAGLGERAVDMVEAIRDEIGSFQTVFGIKLIGDRIGWEYYFYDYARRQRRVSISRVLRAIAPYVRTRLEVNESLPYFMFSLDLDQALVSGERDLDLLHIYLGNPGSVVSSGIAYAVTSRSTCLENFYFFFDAGSQMDDVAKKVENSAMFDASALSLDAVVLPELRRCRTICVANKRTHDCIYFSGIDIHQLIWFLDRLAYPDAIRGFFNANQSYLDHLLFDVGIDYRVSGGEIEILKSGYYGVF